MDGSCGGDKKETVLFSCRDRLRHPGLNNPPIDDWHGVTTVRGSTNSMALKERRHSQSTTAFMPSGNDLGSAMMTPVVLFRPTAQQSSTERYSYPSVWSLSLTIESATFMMLVALTPPHRKSSHVL